MPIPDDVRAVVEPRLDRYCLDRVPAHVRDRVRLGYMIKGMTVTLFEERPHFEVSSVWTRTGIARIRYSKTHLTWTLYWPDRNAKWHVYDNLPSSANFERVLKEIDSDPTGIFWG